MTGHAVKKTRAAGRAPLSRQLPLYLMLVPGVALTLVFAYGPMAGAAIAFQRFLPGRGLFGSRWVGFDNFLYMFRMPNFWQVIYNTVFIAFMKIIAGILVPVTAALLLNEARSRAFKRTVQTVIYLPYFLSWVILSGILITILSPSDGVINALLGRLGIAPVFFLGDARIFPYTIVVTDVWKNFGFGTIIYLAALTAIDPALYEAALVDGANRWRQTLHITLPGILSTVVLMTIISMGNILNAGFEQIFNLYGPVVYETGDIIDTLVYRMGMVDYQYGVATAVGLMKSAVALVLIALTNLTADRLAGYKIF